MLNYWTTCFLVTYSCVCGLTARADVELIQKPATDLFIHWKSGTSNREKQTFYRAEHFTLAWSSSLVPGLVRVEPVARSFDALPDALPNVLTLEQMAQSVANLPGIEHAEPNHRYTRHTRSLRITSPLPPKSKTPTFQPYRSVDLTNLFDELFFPEPLLSPQPNDPFYLQQWALVGQNGIHPDGAWQITHGSKDIKVAIIDSGIDPLNPDLSDRLLPGYDFVDKTTDVTDHFGHGTHVAGIIGAKWNNNYGIIGINSEISFIPIRAIPNKGDESDQDEISAFELAVKAGARIANCSFSKPTAAKAVGEVIAAAGDHGLLVVVAAGNELDDDTVHRRYPAYFHTPNMLVVGSYKEDGSYSDFSNFGPGVVDLAAPGEQIASTVLNNRIEIWDGTSMAAPHVAGVAALALAANPGLSVSALKNIILRGVTVDPKLVTKVTTSGRLNATNTVKLAVGLE